MYLSPDEHRRLRIIVDKTAEVQSILHDGLITGSRFIEVSRLRTEIAAAIFNLPITVKNHYEECFYQVLNEMIDETLSNRDEKEFFRLTALLDKSIKV